MNEKDSEFFNSYSFIFYNFTAVLVNAHFQFILMIEKLSMLRNL